MLSRDRNGLALTEESFALLCRLLVTEHTVATGYTTTKRQLQVLLNSAFSDPDKPMINITVMPPPLLTPILPSHTPRPPPPPRRPLNYRSTHCWPWPLNTSANGSRTTFDRRERWIASWTVVSGTGIVTPPPTPPS